MQTGHWEEYGSARAVNGTPEGEEGSDRKRDVHRNGSGGEADDGVCADFDPFPGRAAGVGSQDVQLAVVEDLRGDSGILDPGDTLFPRGGWNWDFGEVLNFVDLRDVL